MIPTLLHWGIKVSTGRCCLDLLPRRGRQLPPGEVRLDLCWYLAMSLPPDASLDVVQVEVHFRLLQGRVGLGEGLVLVLELI